MRYMTRMNARLRARRDAAKFVGDNNSEKGVKIPGSQNRNKNYPVNRPRRDPREASRNAVAARYNSKRNQRNSD